ncbi:MAG: hypothetical protein HY681_08180 [Chloroflexi bacterium]|nr:hypothetical protein [Chloroflexota bacterium]
MDKAIATALLTIAAVIAVMALINATIPAVGKGASALTSSNVIATERIRTGMEMVYVTGNTTSSTVIAWIKNTGSVDIKPIDGGDIILQTPSTVTRIPYGSGAQYWDYTLEDSETDWGPANTLKITLYLTSLPTGVYTLTYVAHNGIKVSDIFSV